MYPGFNASVGGSFQRFDRDIAAASFTIFQCQSPKPWLASKTLPSQDADNATSPACSFLPGG